MRVLTENSNNQQVKHMANDTTNKPTKAAPKTNPAPATAAPVDKAAQMAKAREAREATAKGDKFIHLGEVKEGTKKLPPQAQVIVNTIAAAGKDGLTREALCKNLEGGVLTTRQPVGRIVSYYQKLIVETGHVKMQSAAPAATPAA
jgi:hypothetical protein